MKDFYQKCLDQIKEELDDGKNVLEEYYEIKEKMRNYYKIKNQGKKIYIKMIIF